MRLIVFSSETICVISKSYTMLGILCSRNFAAKRMQVTATG